MFKARSLADLHLNASQVMGIGVMGERVDPWIDTGSNGVGVYHDYTESRVIWAVR